MYDIHDILGLCDYFFYPRFLVRFINLRGVIVCYVGFCSVNLSGYSGKVADFIFAKF